MIEPTCSQRDAASVIFSLPDYHVIDAIDLPLGGRRVTRLGSRGRPFRSWIAVTRVDGLESGRFS